MRIERSVVVVVVVVVGRRRRRRNDERNVVDERGVVVEGGGDAIARTCRIHIAPRRCDDEVRVVDVAHVVRTQVGRCEEGTTAHE
jgi:hypothetical protein